MKNLITRILALSLALVLVAASACAETLLIGIPDDGTNLSRGIKLLEAAGLIEVDPAAGYTPELKDVTKYIYDIEILPTTANTLSSTGRSHVGFLMFWWLRSGLYLTWVGRQSSG